MGSGKRKWRHGSTKMFLSIAYFMEDAALKDGFPEQHGFVAGNADRMPQAHAGRQQL